jgi:hypothetical protein
MRDGLPDHSNGYALSHRGFLIGQNRIASSYTVTTGQRFIKIDTASRESSWNQPLACNTFDKESIELQFFVTAISIVRTIIGA